MNLPNKTLCVLPWISLETSPIGTVRPCCLAEEEIVDDSGQKFELSQANLKIVQDSDYMQQLRQQFLDGQRPATCRKCWQEEDAGRTSKRLHTLDRLKHIVQDGDWTKHSKPLMFLDLKLGNICNLKCRICGSWSSSQFAVEELKHSDFQGENFHRMMLKRGAWPRENTVFWDQIDDLLDQIRYIEFTGGEPFMIQEHFDMLQRIVDCGIAHQVEIHYNTNGTHYPEQAEEIWQHFRTVEVAFSIDDLESRFEYQRTNAVWFDVCENIEKFRSLRNRRPNMKLQVCATVNIFNVWNIDALSHWIDQQAFDFIYWNMLHEARHFSVASLPLAAKQLAREKLQQAQVRSYHRREFDRIIDFMMAGDGMSAQEIINQIQRLDRRRSQDLRDTIPELAESLGYEGP